MQLGQPRGIRFGQFAVVLAANDELPPGGDLVPDVLHHVRAAVGHVRHLDPRRHRRLGLYGLLPESTLPTGPRPPRVPRLPGGRLVPSVQDLAQQPDPLPRPGQDRQAVVGVEPTAVAVAHLSEAFDIQPRVVQNGGVVQQQ